jgi:tetratricopeptide (TPR) repeat protein
MGNLPAETKMMKARLRSSTKQARTAGGRPDRRDQTRRAPLPDFFWFGVIFAAALLVRLVYSLQIESIPLFYELPGDPRAYDQWAQRIAAGDWLGQGVFYQAPLYPYFLGLLQVALGHDLWAVRIVQAVLGSAACAMIFLAGREWHSRVAGIAAGLIAAIYAPAIFFDLLIDKSVLDLFLLSAFLALAGMLLHRPRGAGWLALGAITGLLALSRENALVLAPLAAIWIFVQFGALALHARLRWSALFIAGLLAILTPVGLRNLKAGGEFKLTTAQFGPNFFIGNNAAADGTYWSVRKATGEAQLEGRDARRLAERAAGRDLTAGEVSDYWFGRALDYIRANPGEWIALLSRKWLMVWNRRELEDSDDIYIYRQWSGLLNLFATFAHFGVLVPLAAAGVWLTRRQWRRLWLLYAMLLLLAASVALFFVFGRYRYPLVPVLALFAGSAAAELWRSYREQSQRRVYPAIAAALLAGVIVNWPLYGYPGAGPGGYINLSNAYYKQGKVSEATSAALKALEIEPQHGVAHYNLGNLYAGQGKLDMARRHFEEALRIQPNFAEAHANLGQLLAEQGEMDAGLRHLGRAIEIDPAVVRAHVNLGVLLAKQGRMTEAVAPLEEAARRAPDSAEYHYYLGSVYAELGRFEDARRSFSAALHARAAYAPAHESLARLYAAQGKTAEAEHHYREALRILKARP